MGGSSVLGLAGDIGQLANSLGGLSGAQQQGLQNVAGNMLGALGGLAAHAGGSPVTTLYECAECNAVTNTVWSWGGRNLCRACFGRERLGDWGSGGVQHSPSVTLVRADGSSVELDKRGVPIESTTKQAIESSVKQAIEAGDASTRKIRVARKEE